MACYLAVDMSQPPQNPNYPSAPAAGKLHFGSKQRRVNDGINKFEYEFCEFFIFYLQLKFITCDNTN